MVIISSNLSLYFSNTCYTCNQMFEQAEQLAEHIPQCPMAQQQHQANPSEQYPDASGGTPAAAGSLDPAGFPQYPDASVKDESPSDTSWQSFMPPDGSSPSGLNLPSASSFFGQQNPNMYNSPGQSSSPGQSPRASTSSGAGGSSGSRVSVLEHVLDQDGGDSAQQRKSHLFFCIVTKWCVNNRSTISILTMLKNLRTWLFI